MNRIKRFFSGFFCSLTLTVAAQGTNAYEIVQDTKGKFSLFRAGTPKAIYKNCLSIDTISNLQYPTHESYKNYFLIHTGKKFIIYNCSGDSAVFSYTCKTYRLEEMQQERGYPENKNAPVSPEPQRQALVFYAEGAKEKISLAFNVVTSTVIHRLHLRSYHKWAIYELVGEGQRIKVLSTFAGGYYEIIDWHGKHIVPETYADNFRPFRGAYAYSDVLGRSYLYGLVNYQGEKLTPFCYKEIHAVPSDPYVIAVDTNGRAGVLSARGEVLIPFIYRATHPNYYRHFMYSDDGVFLFYKNSFKDGDFVFVDTNNRVLTEPGTYKDAWQFGFQERRYFYLSDSAGNQGVFDTRQRKEIIPCRYTFFKEKKEVKQGVIGASNRAGLWGLLSLENGAAVLPFEYARNAVNYISYSDSLGAFILSKDGFFGVADTRGTVRLPFVYNAIQSVSYDKNLLVVQQGGLYGVFDLSKTTFVLPLEYTLITRDLKVEKREGDKLLQGTFREGVVKWK